MVDYVGITVKKKNPFSSQNFSLFFWNVQVSLLREGNKRFGNSGEHGERGARSVQPAEKRAALLPETAEVILIPLHQAVRGEPAHPFCFRRGAGFSREHHNTD